MTKNFTCIGKGHGAPAVPANREAWLKMRREPWLADMCARIEAGDEKLKNRLPIWTPHCAAFKNHHRAIADAEQPLQRLMLDFDEKGHSKEIMDKALALQEAGTWKILLVEDSVRRGTHVLIELPTGMTAEEAQERFSADVGFQADGVVKDVSRCIYMVTEAHTLYVSEGLFEAKAAVVPVCAEESGRLPLVKGDEGPPPPGENADVSQTSYPTTYNEIPYTEIVETLEEQLGGKPDIGSRNNFIFSMACHLRYVCNDEPLWIARILPTYGEEEGRWLATIKSACQRNQSKHRPAIVERTLHLCKRRRAVQGGDTETLSGQPPEMPARLPALIKLLVSKTPPIYQPAVAHAVFPALAAHLWKTTFRYIDNVEHEATLMNCLMAETGAGKNCINEPINRILADIRRRDAENLQREKEWKAEMMTKGANKDKRKRPEGIVVQEIDPDTTNAALVMRLAEAQERFLYTKMNEIDQFDALKNSVRSKAHFQLMCLAFDPGNTYGQTRVGTQSVSERVCVRFNWNASTTIRKGQEYFRTVLTDGPISRINFCTIPERQIGAEMPVYGNYDAAFDEALRPYIEHLNAERGLVECRQAKKLARQLMEENAEFARLSQSRVYENLSFRANVIAYLKAMVLYVANGKKWDKSIEDFIRWSLQYDLWCKMRFFGPAIEAQENHFEPTVSKGPKNLLNLLPEVFTREEARLMRQRQGICGGTVGNMLSNWKKRGYIESYEGGLRPLDINQEKFIKTEAYLKKYPLGQSVSKSVK